MKKFTMCVAALALLALTSAASAQCCGGCCSGCSVQQSYFVPAPQPVYLYKPMPVGPVYHNAQPTFHYAQPAAPVFMGHFQGCVGGRCYR